MVAYTGSKLARGNRLQAKELRMALVWRDEMSIDGSVIDDDHKCLMVLVNEVAVLRPDQGMLVMLDVALARLVTYAEVHFEREESMQTAAAFIYAQAHRSRHRSIAREMAALLAECKTLTRDELPRFHARLCDRLYDWLLDHILKADMMMKPLVAEMRRHARLSESLTGAVRVRVDFEGAGPGAPYRQLLLPSGQSSHRHG
jgi:hemerythrin